jgi:hypothetical protein
MRPIGSRSASMSRGVDRSTHLPMAWWRRDDVPPLAHRSKAFQFLEGRAHPPQHPPCGLRGVPFFDLTGVVRRIHQDIG